MKYIAVIVSFILTVVANAQEEKPFVLKDSGQLMLMSPKYVKMEEGLVPLAVIQEHLSELHKIGSPIKVKEGYLKPLKGGKWEFVPLTEDFGEGNTSIQFINTSNGLLKYKAAVTSEK